MRCLAVAPWLVWGACDGDRIAERVDPPTELVVEDPATEGPIAEPTPISAPTLGGTWTGICNLDGKGAHVLSVWLSEVDGDVDGCGDLGEVSLDVIGTREGPDVALDLDGTATSLQLDGSSDGTLLTGALAGMFAGTTVTGSCALGIVLQTQKEKEPPCE